MQETITTHPKPHNSLNRLPLTLRVAATYLILSGVMDLIYPMTGLGPHHPEFQAQSLAYKLGSYSRELLFGLLFIVSGIGLFLRKSWSRKMALVVIAISTIYSVNSFAWGFARGRPSIGIYAVSAVVMGLWNGLWFYLIYRKKSASEFLPRSDD